MRTVIPGSRQSFIPWRTCIERGEKGIPLGLGMTGLKTGHYNGNVKTPASEGRRYKNPRDRLGGGDSFVEAVHEAVVFLAQFSRKAAAELGEKLPDVH